MPAVLQKRPAGAPLPCPRPKRPEIVTTNSHSHSPTRLTDLSPEIFQEIMAFLVQGDRDFSYLGNARLVSRLFNQEILAEIFWGGVIRRYFSRWPLAIPLEWRARLLRDLIMTKRHSVKNGFLLHVRDVVNTVLHYKRDCSDQAVMNFSTAACSLLVTYLSEAVVAKALPKYFFCSAPDRLLPPTATFIACACVASWLGDYRMYRYFQSREDFPFDRIALFFGPPTWAAAYQGNVDFLERLRDDGVKFHSYNTDDISLAMVPQSALMVASCRPSKAHRDATAVILDAMLTSRGWATPMELRMCAADAMALKDHSIFQIMTCKDVYVDVRDMVEAAFVHECELSFHYGEPSELIKFLLSHGVDPNMKAKFQPAQQNHRAFEQNMLNPLQIAISNKDSSLVALLLRYGADPNFAGMMAHQAPLYMALQHQQPLIVKSLLSHGARKYGPSTYTDETYNLLLVPLVQSQIEIFRDALSLFHIKTSAKDRRVAYSTLDHAVKNGRDDLILALIDAGCTIHGIWDPPLKNCPSPPAPSKPAPARSARVTRSATKLVPTPLPKYHRCLTSPAIHIALQNGYWNTVKMLLGLGAVWNYPYDYVLRRADESPEDVDKRLKELRKELASRDEEIERESVRVEEV